MRSVHPPKPLLLGLLLVLFDFPVAAQVGPPPTWRLYQTEPNPFCREVHGTVLFQVDMPQAAILDIRVWDPSHVRVVRDVITISVPAAGQMWVTWEVRDKEGGALADGNYPYELKATAAGGGVLYQATMVMSVTCEVGVEQRTWGTAKKLFQ